jgi:uncharacterized protein (DUF433 family)
MIDEVLLRRVTFDPEIFGGKPVIRGMRSLQITPSLNRMTCAHA